MCSFSSAQVQIIWSLVLPTSLAWGTGHTPWIGCLGYIQTWGSQLHLSWDIVLIVLFKVLPCITMYIPWNWESAFECWLLLKPWSFANVYTMTSLSQGDAMCREVNEKNIQPAPSSKPSCFIGFLKGLFLHMLIRPISICQTSNFAPWVRSYLIIHSSQNLFVRFILFYSTKPKAKVKF